MDARPERSIFFFSRRCFEGIRLSLMRGAEELYMPLGAASTPVPRAAAADRRTPEACSGPGRDESAHA